jgi:hypothetical protein
MHSRVFRSYVGRREAYRRDFLERYVRPAVVSMVRSGWGDGDAPVVSPPASVEVDAAGPTVLLNANGEALRRRIGFRP